ncbi:MAG: TIGR00269 family protein [Candidatus Methanomethylophilaceae archaeon]|nr:TIGR00269 family protein [Candidatus Methanomethylophilaceae archaeon]
MKCDLCQREAVTLIRYNGSHLCSEHFQRYVERRVKKEIRKQIDLSRGDRIGIAVSGGKDSMVMLKLLSDIFGPNNGIELHAITIDEGIAGYRPPSVDIVRDFCGSRGIAFHLRSFKELGVEMDTIAPLSGENSPCTCCGVFRRRLMNDEARRLDVKLLATGHNLDDMSQSIMMNFTRGDIERLARLGPHTRVQPGLIPRFLPLRTIPEREILLYAMVSGLRFWDGECPYSQEALRNQYRSIVDDLETRSPGAKFSILSSYDTLRPMLYREYSGAALHLCECGEPTVGGRCRSCELLEQMRGRIRGP